MENKTIFNCGHGPNADCNILCGIPEQEYNDYGFNSCKYGIINCGINGGKCNLNVFGDQGFEYGQIQCNQADKCTIKCGNAAACQESIFNASESELFDLQCIRGDAEYYPCNDFKLYCPEMRVNDDGVDNIGGVEKRCYISNPAATDTSDGDVHHELELFCKNSWMDLDIDNYTADIYGNLNMMHCGDGFNNSCILQEGLLTTNSCVCDYGKVETTEIPAPRSPVQEPIDFVLIIAVSIGCFFFVLFALFCTLWMKKDSDMLEYEIWREKQKLEKNRATIWKQW